MKNKLGHNLVEDDPLPGLFGRFTTGDGRVCVDNRHVDERFMPPHPYEDHPLYRGTKIKGDRIYQYVPQTFDSGLNKWDLTISNDASCRHGTTWQLIPKCDPTEENWARYNALLKAGKEAEAAQLFEKVPLITKKDLISTLDDMTSDEVFQLCRSYGVFSVEKLLGVYPTQDRGSIILDRASVDEIEDPVLRGLKYHEVRLLVEAFDLAFRDDELTDKQMLVLTRVFEWIYSIFEDPFEMEDNIRKALDTWHSRLELAEGAEGILIDEPEPLPQWGLPDEIYDVCEARHLFRGLMDEDPWTRGRLKSEILMAHWVVPDALQGNLDALLTYEDVCSIISQYEHEYHQKMDAYESRNDASSLWMNFTFSVESVGTVLEERSDGGVGFARPRPGLLDEPPGDLMNPEEQYLKNSLEQQSTPDNRQVWMGDLTPFADALPYVRSDVHGIYGHPASYWVERVLRMVQRGLPDERVDPEFTPVDVVHLYCSSSVIPRQIADRRVVVLEEKPCLSGCSQYKVQLVGKPLGKPDKTVLQRTADLMNQSRLPVLTNRGVTWMTLDEAYPVLYSGLLRIVEMWEDGMADCEDEVHDILLDIGYELYEIQKISMNLLVEANFPVMDRVIQIWEEAMESVEGSWETADGGSSSAYGAAWSWALHGKKLLKSDPCLPKGSVNTVWRSMGYTLNPNAPPKEWAYLTRMISEQLFRNTAHGIPPYRRTPFISYDDTSPHFSAGIVGDLLAEIYQQNKLPELCGIGQLPKDEMVLQELFGVRLGRVVFKVLGSWGKEKRVRYLRGDDRLYEFARKVAANAGNPKLISVFMAQNLEAALDVLKFSQSFDCNQMVRQELEELFNQDPWMGKLIETL